MRALSYLSAYKPMWVLVLFDLPTGTTAERKAYHNFRSLLLDQSFSMAQFSVYIRHIPSRAHFAPVLKKIEAAMPNEGKVDILQFTDRQYSDIVTLRGRGRYIQRKNPTQLVMF